MDMDTKAIKPKDLKNRIDEFLAIDVRGEGYYLIDHIKNAINIESTKRISYIAKEHSDKKILLYCHHGITAKYMSDELKAMGFDNVYYVDGSFSELVKQGIEIVYYNKE